MGRSALEALLKVCPKCGRELVAQEFARDKSKPSGRKAWCRDCDNTRSRDYYERNADKVLEATSLRQAAALEAARGGPRMCSTGCGRPSTSSQHWFCDECRAAGARRPRRDRRGRSGGPRPKPPGATTRQGYGYRHQRKRAQVAKLVATGRARCWRCGNLIHPHQPWHLGHDDHDRRIYRGPEHRRCNLAAANRSPKRRRRRVSITSRAW